MDIFEKKGRTPQTEKKKIGRTVLGLKKKGRMLIFAEILRFITK